MKRILIIEDDFYIRDVYRRCFINNGYEVAAVDNGNEALEKVKNQIYDAILLDVMLPKINGLEVLRVYRKPDSPVFNTPIFLISNLGQEDVIKEAFKIGADGYFLKARMTPQNLVDEMNDFFARRESAKKVIRKSNVMAPTL